MITIATLGENVKRQYPGKVRKKITKGRPDLWGLGLLRSNAKRLKKSG
jgi:hypothetical protein